MESLLSKMKISIDAFIEIIKFLFWTFILLNISSFIMYLFGISYFDLNYEDNIIVNNIITYIFLYFNLTIFVGIVLSIYDRSIFKVGFIYYILYIISFLAINNFTQYGGIVSFVSPIVFILGYCQVNKCHSKNIYVKFIVWFVLTGAFQLIELGYRELFFELANYDQYATYVEKIVICVNSLIFQILLYILLYKGVNGYEYKSIIYANSYGNAERFLQNTTMDEEAAREIEKMSSKERYLFLLFVVITQLKQFGIIAFVCMLGSGVNGFFELILVLIGFWKVRKILGQSFHFNDVLYCTVCSIVIFFIATRVTPSPYLSTFIPIIVGSFIAILLYYLKLHIDEYNKLKERAGEVEYENDTESE